MKNSDYKPFRNISSLQELDKLNEMADIWIVELEMIQKQVEMVAKNIEAHMSYVKVFRDNVSKRIEEIMQ